VGTGTRLDLTGADSSISAFVNAEAIANGLGGAGHGIQLIQVGGSGSAYSLLAGVDSFMNRDNGLLFRLTANDDAIVGLTDIDSSGNLNQGARFVLNAGDDAIFLGGTNVVSTFGGLAGGPGAVIMSIFSNQIPQGTVSFNDNVGVGLSARITSTGGDIMAGIYGGEANGNGGNGIRFRLDAAAGQITSGFIDTLANNNTGSGLSLSLNGAGGGLILEFSQDSTTNNSANGIAITENYNGGVAILGEYIVSTANGNNGVVINASGLGGAPVMDFGVLGGGPLGSLGQSSIYGNGNRDFRNNGAGLVLAQDNWWGVNPPAAGQFAGAVDYSNWLVAPPIP